MYRVLDYGRMIADTPRMQAYATALGQSVRPGSVVADIGTGTGIFALLACQLGARRVFAIEPADVIQIARETALANGHADRISFFQAASTEITLPEPADVIVSDLRGVLPPMGHHVPAIIDARKRWLAPGGTLIPRRDTLWVAPVHAPELYRRHTEPWQAGAHGLDLGPALRFATNTWLKARVRPQDLVARPVPWAEIDYRAVEGPDLQGAALWRFEQPATAHGLGLWFDAELAVGVSFSNAPERPELIYGEAFFPWPRALAIAPGDELSVELRADLVGQDYVWSWQTRLLEGGQATRREAHFCQSTFLAEPLSAHRLRRQASDYVPRLNEEGRLAQAAFDAMRGELSLEQIAVRLVAELPGRFPTQHAALTYLGELCLRYSQ